MSAHDVEDPPVVVVVMGVSGTGKSTVAGMLAGRLGWDLEEGDDLHLIANVAKMASGRPLTDDDRYRDRLRGRGVAFVHLDGSREVIGARLSNRLDHFMPSSLLESQLATLEPLAYDEAGIVMPLGRRPGDEIEEILGRLHLEAVAPPGV